VECARLDCPRRGGYCDGTERPSPGGLEEVKYRYPLMLQRRPSMYGVIAQGE